MPTLRIAAAIFLLDLVLWKPLRVSRKRLRNSLVFALLGGVTALIPVHGSAEMAVALVAIAGLQTLAGILFSAVASTVTHPRFKVEALAVIGYAVIVARLFHSLGVNVTGIFATSAVATAVVGLALQDMLTNLASGIALELDGEIRSGVFIRTGDTAGWVRHVRLRRTTVETPDGDRVVLPNSLLLRSAVTIYAKAHRLIIPFPMPWGVNPQEVMDAAAAGLVQSPIPGVNAEPAPSCVVRNLAPGHAEYAAIVWTSEPGRETTVVSAVLTRLWFALRRAGLPAGEIATTVELRRRAATSADAMGAVDVLRATPIFRLLDEESLGELGSHLRAVSFAPGEVVLRQGDAGDSMYFVIRGQAGVSVKGADGVERRVAVVTAGDFFGEASLLTGVARSASTTAIEKLDCYRLDKAGLQTFMTRNPELAEDMAVVIAHRQLELEGVRQQMDLEQSQKQRAESQGQLLARIREFFELDAGD